MTTAIKGWRERAGLPASYEITNPSAVERALLEENAELRKAMGWIGVGEQTPPSDEYVWASWSGAGNWLHEPRQGLARYIESLGWQPQGCVGWDWNITHWKRLPAAPTREASA